MRKFSVVVFLLLISVSLGVEKFPKIVWVYWNTALSEAPLITKLCAMNIQRYAGGSGWELRVVNVKTISKWLLDPQRYYSTIYNAQIEMLVQHKADLLRLTLIRDYGGVWIDINSFFLQDFKWLQDPKNEEMIYNKRGEHPQVLIFTYDNYVGVERVDKIEKQLVTDSDTVKTDPGG